MMPPEGQNLREHLADKYGTTPEEGQAMIDRMVEAAARPGSRCASTACGRPTRSPRIGC